MLDHRGQLLRAAVGFAGCSMPSYDRALHSAALLARLLVRHRSRRRRHGAPGLRPSAHSVRREGLAGDVLYDGAGALAELRHWLGGGNRRPGERWRAPADAWRRRS